MSEVNDGSKTLNFTKTDIFKLKELFRGEINSKRRFEEIDTIQELFHVLENRNSLTDDVLLNLDPDFRKFVEAERKKGINQTELVLPPAVVGLISDNYLDERERIGRHLKLTEEEISQCQNVEDVLMKFRENCEGISPQEMIFKLNRALEKCGKGILKSMVVDLIKS